MLVSARCVKLDRRSVADGGMMALAVVEHLDPLDAIAGLEAELSRTIPRRIG